MSEKTTIEEAKQHILNRIKSSGEGSDILALTGAYPNLINAQRQEYDNNYMSAIDEEIHKNQQPQEVL